MEQYIYAGASNESNERKKENTQNLTQPNNAHIKKPNNLPSVLPNM